jgi:PAS domain S-box-containing protein
MNKISVESTNSFLQSDSEMGELVRKFDWSSTSLGPPDQWPPSLRTSVNILLNSQFPMFVWWGQELITIYNDAYKIIAGDKHPALLGRSGRDGWSEIWDELTPLVENVLSGKPTWSEDMLLNINRHGYLEESYFTFSYSPVLSESGEVTGLFCAVIETTEKVISKKKLEESEARFRNMVIQAPMGTCVIDAKTLVVENLNDKFVEIVGKPYDVIMGNPYWETFAEAAPYYKATIEEVIEKGETYYAYEVMVLLIRHGKPDKLYLTFVIDPLRDDNGQVGKVAIWLVDHTEQVVARMKVQESEQELRNVILQAPFATCILRGNKFIVEVANDNMFEFWGKSSGEMMHKPLFDAMPEAKDQGYEELMTHVLETGEDFSAREMPVTLPRNGLVQKVFINFTYRAIREIDGTVSGIIVVAVEVTEQVLARKKIEESERNLRNTILRSPAAICIVKGPNLIVEIANEKMYEIWGHSEEEVLHKSVFEAMPELAEQGFEEILKNVYQTGVPFDLYGAPIKVIRNGTPELLYVNVAYEAFREGDGSISGVIAVTTDVTEQILSRNKIEESEARFRNMVKQAPVAITLTRGSDLVIESVNQPMLFMMGKTHENEVIGKKIIEVLPEVEHQPVLEIVNNVLRTGEIFKGTEVPVSFMEEGKLKERYLNLSYTPLREENSVTGVLHVAIDVTEQVTARRKIEESEAELQKRVIERTRELALAIEELERSNQNLEQFAYAASHDMKEPIRKIHFFSDRLQSTFTNDLTADQIKYFERLKTSANRMATLVDDLLMYSHISRGANLDEKVDLNELATTVLEDLELEREEKKATITIGHLPIINGHKRQLQQLFQNLISNSLKYAKINEDPKITIECSVVRATEIPLSVSEDHEHKQFYLIKFIDEGIGFEQLNADRIFNVFIRLHGNAEYRGTGVGLSIARKVVENHHGIIEAESTPGVGATFKVYLPV